ncbi:unnamed protein product, partial [Ostreobium quekettii]
VERGAAKPPICVIHDVLPEAKNFPDTALVDAKPMGDHRMPSLANHQPAGSREEFGDAFGG